MKHILSILLAAILVTTFLLASCAAPTPSPSTSPTPAPTPTPSTTQTIKLKFANHEPAVTVNNKIYAEWAGKIKEQTQGRVEIEIYPAEALAKSRDMYNSLVGGICDIAAVLAPFARDNFPLNGILLQPLGSPPYMDGVKIWTELYNKFPAMQAEFADVHLLFTWLPGNQFIHFTKKQAKVPADIKGMKLFSESASTLELFGLAGATPVFSPITEAYMGLERGLAEGLTAPYDALRVFGLTEIVKHHLELAVGAPQCFVIMNTSKWNSLSAEDQKIIMDLSPWVSEAICKAKEEEVNGVKKQGAEMGQTFYVPTAEEYKLWSALFPKSAEKWIADQEAKGFPAKALYQEASQLAAKYH